LVHVTVHRFASIVLAAGMSRRMGRPKVLLPLGDRPLIAHVVGQVEASPLISRVVVVTGSHDREIRAALTGHDINFANNPDFATGEMLSSVKTGLRALADARPDAICIVLGDQPGVATATIDTICRAWSKAKPPIVRPTYRGRHGHPILIAAEYIPEIVSLGPDSSLKDFVTRHAARAIDVSVDDPAVVDDIDTPADYLHVLEQRNASSTQERLCQTANTEA
jgi:molybdenum cofactor cytidylyltransferase